MILINYHNHLSLTVVNPYNSPLANNSYLLNHHAHDGYEINHATCISERAFHATDINTSKGYMAHIKSIKKMQ
jgi:hypothetical protein